MRVIQLFLIPSPSFSNSEESEGFKERKKNHGRIPDLTLDITLGVSHHQSVFLCEVKSVS